eukprot:TRINITY_DN178_c0_g1_i7.p1 TRINITY_DN178_c0_g1~~TRINITY_DN178_c0_g1_i7.p1  ORF type:complete len:210 (-),score=29.39 TRINITY_DN178_c0_g1_i7:125-754(-)
MMAAVKVSIAVLFVCSAWETVHAAAAENQTVLLVAENQTQEIENQTLLFASRAICACEAPGAGTNHHNRYICDNGFSAWCHSDEECYQTGTFPFGMWSQGCRRGSRLTCSATFVNQDLAGVDVYKTTVMGSSDAELDTLCCSYCDGDADCQFWVREAGSSGSKRCWLKKDASTTFSRNADRRGALKQARRMLDVQTPPKPALRGACVSC